MNVSFVSFPMVPAENNLFHHTGNPDLSAFTCDVSAVDPSGSVDCNITDLVNTNVKGVCHTPMCACVCACVCVLSPPSICLSHFPSCRHRTRRLDPALRPPVSVQALCLSSEQLFRNPTQAKKRPPARLGAVRV